MFTTLKSPYNPLKQLETMKNKKKTALGAAYGVTFRIIVGVLTDNIGLWLSLGIAIGCGVGSLLNQKKPDNNS